MRPLRAWILLLPLLVVVQCARKNRRNKPAIKNEISNLMSQSLGSHRKQACEGKRLVLRCPQHTHILVESTFYGRVVPSSEFCPPSEQDEAKRSSKASEQRLAWEERYEDTSCDVTNAHTKVVEKCQNRKKCRVHAKPHFFGRDPCPTTSKYLQISYKCKPSQFNSEYFCEGDTMQLSCRSGKRLALYSATWGADNKQSKNQCRAGETVPYDCTADILGRLTSHCHAQKQCAIAVRDEVFGNPCPFGVKKYLNLIFMCVAESVFNEAALEGRLEDITPAKDKQRPKVSSTDLSAVVVEPVRPPPSPTAATETPPSNDGWSSFVPESNVPRLASPEVERTSTIAVPIIKPTTCIPPSIPNAIGFAQNWIATWTYLKANKEKSILYFCLSASAGLILLLAVCIGRQCIQKSTTNSDEEQLYDRALANQFGGSKMDLDSTTNGPQTLFETDSRIGVEVSDIGRNGVSYMRFGGNHLTPPRTHTMNYYSAS